MNWIAGIHTHSNKQCFKFKLAIDDDPLPWRNKTEIKITPDGCVEHNLLLDLLNSDFERYVEVNPQNCLLVPMIGTSTYSIQSNTIINESKSTN